ncbi:MAG: helix-turn-helix domain-containing protein [Thermodesulfobacteriota bacterium]
MRRRRGRHGRGRDAAPRARRRVARRPARAGGIAADHAGIRRRRAGFGRRHAALRLDGREREPQLLDAALRVFLARGYDGATTGEMARAADVAAGTFYLHFRDKRAAYEQLARRAAHELLTSWRAALRPGTPMAESVGSALRLAADYWRADLARAKLLLEGGPSLGSENHVRLIDEIAVVLAATASAPRRATRAVQRAAHAHALIGLGLGIEIGRLIVARPGAAREVDDLIRLLRTSLRDEA